MTAPGGRSKFRFGVGLPNYGPFASPENIIRFAEHAEALGFDDVWLNDHVTLEPSAMGGSPAGTVEAIKPDQAPDFYELISTAAFVAGRVRRIGVALGGLQAPLRHPVIVAKQIASLSELSGGRLTFAPAVGGMEKDFEVLQKPWNKRGKLFDEYLAAQHAIWFGEQPVTFEGSTYSFKDAWLSPKPKSVRLWITGETEPALQRTVRWGSGWFSAYPPLSTYPEKVTRLRELATEAGRDPDAIDTATIIFLCVGDTRQAALQVCEATMVRRFKSLDRGLELSAVGSPAEVQEQLAARYTAGLRYLELRFWAHDPGSWMAMVQRTAEEVLPALRRLT